MTRQERYDFVLDWFAKNNPDAETELLYDDPFQLLVAVMLSAQCTDKRVNMTTPYLFAQFPDAQALSKATVEEIYAIIKSISYPNSKAKHLLEAAKLLVQNFGGEVPHTVEELVTLPGVGRKTANVITSVIDQQPNMAVDTHVFRVSARLGLTLKAKNVLQTEKQLVAHIPESLVFKAHHWLILHGRYICVARTPKCGICGLRPACKYFATTVVKAKPELADTPMIPGPAQQAAEQAAKTPGQKKAAPKRAAAKKAVKKSTAKKTVPKKTAAKKPAAKKPSDATSKP